jgi:hypothetical protein
MMQDDAAATPVDTAEQPDATTRKLRFAEAIRDGVPAARAVEEAGYHFGSENSRRALISKLLRDPEVRKIACPEPQDAEELAARVWQMQASLTRDVAKANLLILYAKLRGYLAKPKSEPATPAALDENIEFPEE